MCSKKIFIVISLFFVALFLYKKQKIFANKTYVARLVQDTMSLTGNVTVKKLSGNSNKVINFLVIGDHKKYVVRIFKQNADAKIEIYNFKVASDEGYGPKVYFADESQRFLIMEYLEGKDISDQELDENKICIMLAHLLQKIHNGKAFKNSCFSAFKKISRAIESRFAHCSKYIPLKKLSEITTLIQNVVTPFLSISPSHNDLHGGNLVFMESEFKALDYECAAPADPYFDLSGIVAYFYFNQAQEKIFFSTYLKRKPLEWEQAKLYLGKQVYWIKILTSVLKRIPLKDIHLYEEVEAPSLKFLMRKNFKGEINLVKTVNKLKVLKALFRKIFDNFESQKFKDSVRILKERSAQK